MNKQDKIVEEIMHIVNKLRLNEYSGGVMINFTNGKVANKLTYKESKQILDLNSHM